MISMDAEYNQKLRGKWKKILSNQSEFDRILGTFGVSKKVIVVSVVNGSVIILLSFAFLLAGVSAFENQSIQDVSVSSTGGTLVNSLFSSGTCGFVLTVVSKAQTSELPEEQLQSFVEVLLKKFRTELTEGNEDSDLLSTLGGIGLEDDSDVENEADDD